MDAEMMDRMELVARVQACARRVEKAAVDCELACEACAHEAGEASAWCRGEDVAELAEVSQTLGERLAETSTVSHGASRTAWWPRPWMP